MNLLDILHGGSENEKVINSAMITEPLVRESPQRSLLSSEPMPHDRLADLQSDHEPTMNFTPSNAPRPFHALIKLFQPLKKPAEPVLGRSGNLILSTKMISEETSDLLKSFLGFRRSKYQDVLSMRHAFEDL